MWLRESFELSLLPPVLYIVPKFTQSAASRAVVKNERRSLSTGEKGLSESSVNKF